MNYGNEREKFQELILRICAMILAHVNEDTTNSKSEVARTEGGLHTTAFPRPQWKASADEDDKRRLGVITSRNGPEWQCTNWSGQPQTEMHGDRKLLLLPSDPPNDPTGRGTE
ncbi:hypothetical protein ElyMa_005908100 [Elysia marginata]|uniref:Uncharacterized protein n=1 Tax=Elysia marginata TaxID=1093978 RepID=A0AAV4G755_9GAST|nr:hypothetical protein ElyMa_005908100 [Elysia marginata]